MIDLDSIKLYSLNATSFSIACFSWLEPALEITLLLATLGYTIHKWYLVKKGKKKK